MLSLVPLASVSCRRAIYKSCLCDTSASLGGIFFHDWSHAPAGLHWCLLTADAGNSSSGRTESQGVILSSGVGQTTSPAIPSPGPISVPQPLKNVDSHRKTDMAVGQPRGKIPLGTPCVLFRILFHGDLRSGDRLRRMFPVDSW